MNNKLSPLIKERLKKHRHNINILLNKIIAYDHIAIFRHIRPDYDAMGSQLGLYYWIKENFPSKDVKFLGENHVSLSPRCFPNTDVVADSWFKDNKVLAIVVDTSTKGRVSDTRYTMGDYIVKIDHHPENKKYGYIQLVETTCCAAAEFVLSIILSFGNEYVLSKRSASFFYKGIVGDSNRFMYNSTSPMTFEIAKIILETGIKLSKVYAEMYQKDMNDLEITSYILNHLQFTKKGVGYYVLDKDEMEMLHLPPERGKDNIDLFDHVKGVEIWCSITEEAKDGYFRVSIRSKEIPINGVAAKYSGGGHAQASGAKIKNLDELPNLLKDLDDLIN